MGKMVLRIMLVALICITGLVAAGCGGPTATEEATAKYDEMIQAYIDMRRACDEAQGMETYAETLKVNLEAITVRYNEIYAENVRLQAQYSEVVAKYQLLASQYNNLKSNYESVMYGMTQSDDMDVEMRKYYEELSKQYEKASERAGKYDALLNTMMMVSRRDCPEINAMPASERAVFYKGWNMWGTAYVADFYKPFSLVPGEFDSLWATIEMVSDRECYELEQGMTEAEMTSFLKVWDMWREKYVDSYEDSGDFTGLLAVVLQVSRQVVPEINEMTADFNAFYKGWGIWGTTYVQPIIP